MASKGEQRVKSAGFSHFAADVKHPLKHARFHCGILSLVDIRYDKPEKVLPP